MSEFQVHKFLKRFLQNVLKCILKMFQLLKQLKYHLNIFIVKMSVRQM